MAAAVALPHVCVRECIDALCALTLSHKAPRHDLELLEALDDEQRAEFLRIADANHVLLRMLLPVVEHTTDEYTRQWAIASIMRERARVENALLHLRSVCNALETAGCPVTVIKTLEHQPDLGNDLDLFTTGAEQDVLRVMTEHFQARIEPRSWGDRLAQKWNFALPELPELVEVHVQRLGQTGEHTDLARRFVTQRRLLEINGLSFPVPAPEERIIVATLQRMYRHFYLRVCDVVNAAKLVESNTVDFDELKRTSDYGGIWPGVASFLVIVSDIVQRYRGEGLKLPQPVRAAAVLGGAQICVRGGFLRVPVMPGAALYTRQVTRTALRGDVPAAFRLTLLPPLASAAAIVYRITGSDKGIW